MWQIWYQVILETIIIMRDRWRRHRVHQLVCFLCNGYTRDLWISVSWIYSVRWHVLDKTKTVSEAQLGLFREYLWNIDNKYMKNNFRPIQSNTNDKYLCFDWFDWLRNYYWFMYIFQMWFWLNWFILNYEMLY